MDIYKQLTRFREGYITPQEIRRKLKFQICNRLFSESSLNLDIPLGEKLQDLSVLNNRLLVAHSGFHVSLYNVERPSSVGYHVVKNWKEVEAQKTCTGFECVNFNPENTFFTFSGCERYIFCVDLEYMKTIEKVDLKNICWIFQHRPSLHRHSLIIAATKGHTHKVIFADLLSGHTWGTVPEHSSNVGSVSFCGMNENLFASASSTEKCFWDRRMLNRCLLKNEDNCELRAIIPEIQLLPYSDKVILLNPDRTCTIWDVQKLTSDTSIGTMAMPHRALQRYKFSIISSSKPQLLFMPADKDIFMYDLTKNKQIGQLKGHLMPVQTLVFNDIKNELYSASIYDGSIIWVPKPFGD